MALSGSQYELFHNSCHKLIVEWSASQNVGGNYSTVTANLYVQGTQGWSTIYSGSVAKSVALVINGNRKSGTAWIDISGTEKRLLLSHTVNVPHNSDGTKSFRIEGMWNPQITWSGTYYGSEEWTRQDWSLNAIPRASTFNQSATTFNMDGEGTIYINPANASFKHKLYMHFGNKRPLLKDNPPVNQNFNVQFSASEFASQIPNATSGVGTLTLETYNGNTLIGSSSRQTYLKLPSNYVPSQPSVTVSDESSVPAKLGVSKTAGFYIKGMSLLRFNCSASGVLGSTINNYQVQIGNQTFATGGGTIDVDLSKFDIGVGKVKAMVTVTDSRGRSNSKTVELNIREYQAPKILNFNVSRQNNSDTVIITKKAKAQKIVSSNRTVLTTNYEYSQGAIDTYSKSGYTGTWSTTTPLSNLSVGEVVLLQLYNTSRCDYDLIIASVNTINSNSVNTTSIGLDNSTNYNSYTVRTEYKLSSAETWTAWRTETDSSATINSSGWDVTKSYDIRVILADKLNQTVVMASISTAKTLVSYYKDIGVGIGKMWERGVLDVGGDTYFSGTVNGTTIKQNGNSVIDASNFNTYFDNQYAKTFDTRYEEKIETEDKGNISLGWGLQARVIKRGNTVTIAVWRQVVAFNGSGEFQPLKETLPSDIIPPHEVNLILAKNAGSVNPPPMTIHFQRDGSIKYTNFNPGTFVHCGTVTYQLI